MAKIRVPEASGELVLTYQGNDPKTYKITDHLVTVANEDVAIFLDSVTDSAAHDEVAKKIDAAADPSGPALPAA